MSRSVALVVCSGLKTADVEKVVGVPERIAHTWTVTWKLVPPVIWNR